MRETKITTISIDKDLWQKFKLHCIRKNTYASKMIRKYIEAELRKADMQDGIDKSKQLIQRNRQFLHKGA